MERLIIQLDLGYITRRPTLDQAQQAKNKQFAPFYKVIPDEIDPQRFQVQSHRDPTFMYDVTIPESDADNDGFIKPACSCEHWFASGKLCYHIAAVEYFQTHNPAMNVVERDNTELLVEITSDSPQSPRDVGGRPSSPVQARKFTPLRKRGPKKGHPLKRIFTFDQSSLSRRASKNRSEVFESVKPSKLKKRKAVVLSGDNILQIYP